MSQGQSRFLIQKSILQNQYSEPLSSSSQEKNLQQSYGRFKERATRAVSLYEENKNDHSYLRDFTKKQLDPQQSYTELLDEKILLCYPNNYEKQNDSYGFFPFKQLKLQYLQGMPVYKHQKQSKYINYKDLVQDNQQLDLQKLKQRKISPTNNTLLKLNDKLGVLYHNKKMKSLYEATMFKRNDNKNQEIKVQRGISNLNRSYLNQSKAPESLDRLHRSLGSRIIQSKNNNRTFKEQLVQSDADQYINKIYGVQQKPSVYGFIRKLKATNLPYTLPECREGSLTVKISDRKAILIGGYSYKEHRSIQSLDLDSYRWDMIDQQTQNKEMRAVGCSFQVTEYQNTIYLIGGERRVGGLSTTNELWMLKNNQWDQIKYVGDFLPPRKNFSIVLANKGTQLVVIGGVGSELNFLKDMHAIDLIYNKNVNLHLECPLLEQGIAYHCSFTIPFDQGGPGLTLYSDYKKKLAKTDEGIYIFGGKNKANKSYTQLYMIKSNIMPHKVEEIATKGRQPAGSLNYSSKGNMVMIFGGTDGERIFNDLYLLFIANMQWVFVKLNGDFLKPRFGHCSLFHDTSLVIFGGVCNEGFLTYEPYVIELNQDNTKELMKQISSEDSS